MNGGNSSDMLPTLSVFVSSVKELLTACNEIASFCVIGMFLES